MLLLFSAFFCLASAISANKILLFSLSPELLVGLRMTFGALLLGLVSYIRFKEVFPLRVVYHVGSWLFGIALCTTFFPSNLKAYALAAMPSSKMAFFGTLDPLVAALFSYVLFSQKITIRQWGGIGIGFVGMMILLATSSPLEEQMIAFFTISWPEIAAFLAIVISRLGWMQGQQLLKQEHLTPTQFTLGTMAIGGILSLAMVFLKGSVSLCSLAHANFPILRYPPLSLMSSSYQLGLFLSYTIGIGNMLGYTLYAHALKRYSVTFIALSGFSIPLLVQALGWLFLGEPLSWSFFVACGVTFCGVYLFFLDEPGHAKPMKVK